MMSLTARLGCTWRKMYFPTLRSYQLPPYWRRQPKPFYSGEGILKKATRQGESVALPLSLSSPICQNWNVAARYLERVLKSTDFRTLHNFPAIEGHGMPTSNTAHQKTALEQKNYIRENAPRHKIRVAFVDCFSLLTVKGSPFLLSFEDRLWQSPCDFQSHNHQ